MTNDSIIKEDSNKRTLVAGAVALAAGVSLFWFMQPGPDPDRASLMPVSAPETTVPVTEPPTTTTLPPTTTTTATTTAIRPRTTTTKRPTTPRVSRSRPAVTGDVWSRLAMCESGMRNDGGAPYYGYFQFSASTWRAVGGSGLPDQHSYETQLAFAQKLQARSGWAQWPACSRKLGLR